MNVADHPTSAVCDSHAQWYGHDYWLLSSAGRPPYVLFAPTLRLALLLNASATEAIQTGRTPPHISTRLSAALSKAVAPVAAPPNAFHLGIGLTRNCTLACLYCHAEADKPRDANWSTLQTAIEYAAAAAAKTPRRTLSVSFAVGGEPTMPWDLFTRAVVTLKHLVVSPDSGVDRLFLSMTTNGYYGPDRRQFIAAHFDHLTVSLDGDQNIQDLHRPNRAGRGSYAVVCETIRHFLTVPTLRLGIRSTVSAKSVDHLPMIIQRFACEFGRGFVVAFEPLVPLGRALVSPTLQPPELTVFLEKFKQAEEIGAELGIRVTSSGPSLKRLITRYCGAMTIPSFAVCVDGQITACHRDHGGTDYGYGTIQANSGKIILDQERLNHIAELNAVPEACCACFARWHCAGDCPDLRRIGWSRCHFNRAVLYDQIVALLTREKGGEQDE
ncbi:MAG: radical SAM protein [Acidobacteria bacterium]|nr:radical SAM protein [Acidobacteriota bacterium]